MRRVTVRISWPGAFISPVAKTRRPVSAVPVVRLLILKRTLYSHRYSNPVRAPSSKLTFARARPASAAGAAVAAGTRRKHSKAMLNARDTTQNYPAERLLRLSRVAAARGRGGLVARLSPRHGRARAARAAPVGSARRR